MFENLVHHNKKRHIHTLSQWIKVGKWLCKWCKVQCVVKKKIFSCKCSLTNLIFYFFFECTMFMNIGVLFPLQYHLNMIYIPYNYYFFFFFVCVHNTVNLNVKCITHSCGYRHTDVCRLCRWIQNSKTEQPNLCKHSWKQKSFSTVFSSFSLNNIFEENRKIILETIG